MRIKAMKNILIISLIVLTSLGLSCKNTDNVTNDCEVINVQDDLSQLTTDEFRIDTAYVQNNCLKLKVNYGGGCGNVFFKMYRNHTVFQSNPQQTTIKLTLDDKDFCKALIYKDLSYDITDLTKEIGKPVLIRIENYNHMVRVD